MCYGIVVMSLWYDSGTIPLGPFTKVYGNDLPTRRIVVVATDLVCAKMRTAGPDDKSDRIVKIRTFRVKAIGSFYTARITPNSPATRAGAAFYHMYSIYYRTTMIPVACNVCSISPSQRSTTP